MYEGENTIGVSNRRMTHQAHTKLRGMNPGLIKIICSYGRRTPEGFALVMTPSLADHIMLPNNVLDYRPMLHLNMTGDSRIAGKLEPFYRFHGHEIRDEHIENVEGRVVRIKQSNLDPSDPSDFSASLNISLIPVSSPYFRDAFDEVLRVLRGEGGDAEKSSWRDYEKWEEERLKTFR